MRSRPARSQAPKAWRDWRRLPSTNAAIKQRLTLRDYGSIRGKADTALFVANDNARYLTGAIVDCNGGAGLGDVSAAALIVVSGRPMPLSCGPTPCAPAA